jgi:5-amino-6-(5-phosphoribosylamino)uracil reductase
MANMVSSVDGAYATDGRSGGLSGPADRAMFHALRGIADDILVAAGTARAERYRRPSPEEGSAEIRAAHGQRPAARLVLVSRSLHIPDDQPFLTGDGPDPIVLHPAGSDTSALPTGLESRGAGEDELDLAAALASLGEDGSRMVLCEGGPSLLGQLVAADLIDELFITTSPTLVGGSDVGILGHHTDPVDRPMTLHRVLVDDGFLLSTYRRIRN